MSIKLYNADSNAGRVLSRILQVKELAFESSAQVYPKADAFKDEPTLVVNGHAVHGTYIVLPYIEQKYPHPNLYPSDPEKTSLITMLFRQLLDTAEPIEDGYASYLFHLKHHAFVSGDKPNLIDVTLTALVPKTDFWHEFEQRVLKALHVKSAIAS